MNNCEKKKTAFSCSDTCTRGIVQRCTSRIRIVWSMLNWGLVTPWSWHVTGIQIWHLCGIKDPWHNSLGTSLASKFDTITSCDSLDIHHRRASDLARNVRHHPRLRGIVQRCTPCETMLFAMFLFSCFIVFSQNSHPELDKANCCSDKSQSIAMSRVNICSEHLTQTFCQLLSRPAFHFSVPSYCNLLCVQAWADHKLSGHNLNKNKFTTVMWCITRAAHHFDFMCCKALLHVICENPQGCVHSNPHGECWARMIICMQCLQIN